MRSIKHSTLLYLITGFIFSFPTFKLAHEVLACLWVETGADQGDEGKLLHLLFVCCRETHQTKVLTQILAVL